jgi:hypothetical protein
MIRFGEGCVPFHRYSPTHVQPANRQRLVGVEVAPRFANHFNMAWHHDRRGIAKMGSGVFVLLILFFGSKGLVVS